MFPNDTAVSPPRATVKNTSGRRIRRVLLASLTAFGSFAGAMLSGPGTASAVPDALSAMDHEGQLSSGTYTNGAVSTYAELDPVNFRFTLEADDEGTGRMVVSFTEDNGPGDCTFFDGSFTLGTHDNSNDPVESVSGDVPDVTLVGTPIVVSDRWVQEIEVAFEAAGEAVVYYHLVLSDEAEDCGNGAAQNSQLDDADAPGDFRGVIGNQTVPVSANLAERGDITVTKNIDRDGDGTFEDTATEGEFCFSLDGGNCVATDQDGVVVFADVSSGPHTITETQLDFTEGTYVFASGAGDSCEFDGQGVATATVQTGFANANPNQAQLVNANCVFNNEVVPPATPGSITIVKETLPVGMGSFDFVTTGAGLSDFTLDFDQNTSETNTITFSDLDAGDYTVEEQKTGGWYVSDLSCSGDGTWSQDPNNRRLLNISLGAGGDLVCTYENTFHPWITIVKETVPADQGSFDFTATGPTLSPFTLDFSSANSNVKAFKGLIPANYTVTEAVTPGWTLANVECDTGTWQVDPNNARRLLITLDAGDRITCTFTNREETSNQVNIDLELDLDVDVVDPVLNPSGQPSGGGNLSGAGQTSGGSSDTSQQSGGTGSDDDALVLGAGLTSEVGPVGEAPVAAVESASGTAPLALGELPRTGVGILMTTLVGCLLIAFGGLARLAGRRRGGGLNG